MYILTAWSQGYFRCRLHSYCNRPMSARDGGWLPGTAKSPSPASPRPSCRHCGVRKGRTAWAPSRPSWRNLGRPTVPGRPTGRLTSLALWHPSIAPASVCWCEIAHAGQGMWMVLAAYPPSRLHNFHCQLLALLPSTLAAICRRQIGHAGQSIWMLWAECPLHSILNCPVRRLGTVVLSEIMTWWTGRRILRPSRRRMWMTARRPLSAGDGQNTVISSHLSSPADIREMIS